jgi:hypothetical protein
MAGDILDRFCIHPRNDAIGDESFPGSVVNKIPVSFYATRSYKDKYARIGIGGISWEMKILFG